MISIFTFYSSGAAFIPNVSFGSSDPFFGWSNSWMDYLNVPNDSNNILEPIMNQGVNIESVPKTSEQNDEKASNALLDARLKVIEARLKITKPDPDEVVVISDEDSDDEGQRDFQPKISSTLVKKEKDE